MLAESPPKPRIVGRGGRVLHSWRTPRGVHPVNSPRAGRQQGSTGSSGCAGSPYVSCRERPQVSFLSLGRDELVAEHEQQQRNYADLQAKKLSLDLTRGKP